MADTISARDANQRFSRLLAEVEAGKSFVITNRGRPVARIVPEPASARRKRLTPEQEQALAETEAFALSLKPSGAGPVEPMDRDSLHDRDLDR